MPGSSGVSNSQDIVYDLQTVETRLVFVKRKTEVESLAFPDEVRTEQHPTLVTKASRNYTAISAGKVDTPVQLRHQGEDSAWGEVHGKEIDIDSGGRFFFKNEPSVFQWLEQEDDTVMLDARCKK
ncbi:hypothetical protein K438DRAFT_1956477 [Mycena galopus ATCC 62051]|nr:hypothetical protein K438DRAFT_1956477 [Mycena galopus ATCC 62051]